MKRLNILLGMFILILLGIVLLLYNYRIDMTAGGLYSPAGVTKKQIRELNAPVAVTYYISSQLREAYAGPGHVINLLQEYKRIRNGAFNLTIIDPYKEERVDEMRAYGVLEYSIPAQGGEEPVGPVCSGAVIEYKDRTAVIPYLFYPDSAELDVTRSLRELHEGRRITLGIITGDASIDFDTDYSALTNVFSGRYEITRVSTQDPVPDDVTVLFVLGNEDLDEEVLWYIERFILTGGRVLFAFDGLVPAEKGQVTVLEPLENTSAKFIETLGFRLRNRPLISRNNASLTFGNSTVSYPLWPLATVRQHDRERPITEMNVILPFASGAGYDTGQPGVTHNRLMVVPEAHEVDEESVLIDIARDFGPDFASGRPEDYTVAVAAEGVFPAFFSATEKSRFTRLLLISCGDVFSNLILAAEHAGTPSRAPGNFRFAEYCFLYLSPWDDLAVLRTKSHESPQLYQTTKTLDFWSAVMVLFPLAGLPVCLVLLMLLGRLLVRRL